MSTFSLSLSKSSLPSLVSHSENSLTHSENSRSFETLTTAALATLTPLVSHGATLTSSPRFSRRQFPSGLALSRLLSSQEAGSKGCMRDMQENDFLHDVFDFTLKKKYLNNNEHMMSGLEKRMLKSKTTVLNKSRT
ncbi:hypothetical protein RIF29_10751 [Crotalaria pallida]|uniref:Interferon-related developmental regulator C-terminal domain-containing protein n=1 Tax=Crotalaria pallida TaxID=3830 RepID=A0AAN9FZ68_CROPI